MIGYQAGGARLCWAGVTASPPRTPGCDVVWPSCYRVYVIRILLCPGVSSADAGVQVSSLQGWCRSQISSSRAVNGLKNDC